MFSILPLVAMISAISAAQAENGVTFGGCLPNKTNCSVCYTTLKESLLKRDDNVQELSRKFFPPRANIPEVVEVIYIFGENINDTQVWFWTIDSSYLFFPIETFQFLSLFFAKPAALFTQKVTLHLDEECSDVDHDILRLLTQRLKNFIQKATFAPEIDDNYFARTQQNTGDNTDDLLSNRTATYVIISYAAGIFLSAVIMMIVLIIFWNKKRWDIKLSNISTLSNANKYSQSKIFSIAITMLIINLYIAILDIFAFFAWKNNESDIQESSALSSLHIIVPTLTAVAVFLMIVFYIFILSSLTGCCCKERQFIFIAISTLSPSLSLVIHLPYILIAYLNDATYASSIFIYYTIVFFFVFGAFDLTFGCFLGVLKYRRERPLQNKVKLAEINLLIRELEEGQVDGQQLERQQEKTQLKKRQLEEREYTKRQLEERQHVERQEAQSQLEERQHVERQEAERKQEETQHIMHVERQEAERQLKETQHVERQQAEMDLKERQLKEMQLVVKQLNERQLAERQQSERQQVERKLAEKQYREIIQEEGQIAEQKRQKKRHKMQKKLEKKLLVERHYVERQLAEKQLMERQEAERQQAEKQLEARQQMETQHAECQLDQRQLFEKQVAERQLTEEQDNRQVDASESISQRQEVEKYLAMRQRECKQLTERQQVRKQLAENQFAERQQAWKQLMERQQAERHQAERQLAESQLAERQQTERQQAMAKLAKRHQSEKEQAKRQLGVSERQLAERQQAERKKAKRQLKQKHQMESKQAERQLLEGQQAERELTNRQLAERQLAEEMTEYGCKGYSAYPMFNSCSKTKIIITFLCVIPAFVVFILVLVGMVTATLVVIPISKAVSDAPNRLFGFYQIVIVVLGAYFAYRKFFYKRPSLRSVIEETDENILDSNGPSWKGLSNKEKVKQFYSHILKIIGNIDPDDNNIHASELPTCDPLNRHRAKSKSKTNTME